MGAVAQHTTHTHHLEVPAWARKPLEIAAFMAVFLILVVGSMVFMASTEDGDIMVPPPGSELPTVDGLESTTIPGVPTTAGSGP